MRAQGSLGDLYSFPPQCGALQSLSEPLPSPTCPSLFPWSSDALTRTGPWRPLQVGWFGELSLFANQSHLSKPPGPWWPWQLVQAPSTGPRWRQACKWTAGRNFYCLFFFARPAAPRSALGAADELWALPVCWHRVCVFRSPAQSLSLALSPVSWAPAAAACCCSPGGPMSAPLSPQVPLALCPHLPTGVSNPLTDKRWWPLPESEHWDLPGHFCSGPEERTPLPG
jgi:hypothetical protein